jgi:hypothetical protein
MLQSASNNGYKQLVGNRHAAGIRLLLPTRIARKFAGPKRWIAEARNDYEKAKKEVSKDEQRYESNHRFEIEVAESFIHDLCDQLKIEKTVGNHSFVATSNCPESSLMPIKLERSQQEFYVLEVSLVPSDMGYSPGLAGRIIERWEKIIRQPIIPFDFAVRRRDLKHAYEALEQFILAHELMKRKGILH